MAAEPQTANLQADQMRCLVAWINTRNFYVDNVKMSAVTASDGFASYTHIEIICCDAKTRLLTHTRHTTPEASKSRLMAGFMFRSSCGK